MRSDEQQTDTDQTPEPEMSARSGRPESSSSDRFESPELEAQRYQQNYQSYEADAGWGEYEANQTWEEEPDQQENYGDINYGKADPSSYDNYEPIEGFVL